MHLLFGFSGRIGRGQWWLAQTLLIVLVVALVAVIAFGLPRGGQAESLFGDMSAGAMLAIAAVFVLGGWINLASTVKRFHDRNKPGIWFLMTFVPYVGSFWILVECGFLAGTPGRNQFGSPDGTGRTSALDDFDIEAVSGAATPRRSTPVVKPAVPAAHRPPRGGGSVPSFGRRTA